MSFNHAHRPFEVASRMTRRAAGRKPVTRVLGVLVVCATAAIGAFISGCRPSGPSQAQVDAERAAFAAVMDQELEIDRVRHACDKHKTAYMDALKASMVVLKDESK